VSTSALPGSALAAGALLCGILACGGAGRPALPAWQASWAQVRALVPEEQTFESRDAMAHCTALLAAIRERRDSLVPAPSESLDAAVGEWLDRAEGLAFECPAGPAQREARKVARERLAVLEAEIAAGLEEARRG
jgi:hypothetical protein